MRYTNLLTYLLTYLEVPVPGKTLLRRPVREGILVQSKALYDKKADDHYIDNVIVTL